MLVRRLDEQLSYRWGLDPWSKFPILVHPWEYLCYHLLPQSDFILKKWGGRHSLPSPRVHGQFSDMDCRSVYPVHCLYLLKIHVLILPRNSSAGKVSETEPASSRWGGSSVSSFPARSATISFSLRASSLASFSELSTESSSLERSGSESEIFTAIFGQRTSFR